MTPEKQRQKLQGQTSIAQKVFEFVPIAESWGMSQIATAMYTATRSRIDPRILGGVMVALKNAGLVRESAGSTYRREPINNKEAAPVTTTPKTHPPAAPAAPSSAIDLLAGIAKSMRALAGEIESAALAIEEGQSKTTEEVQKLRQLQALLKGLA